MLKYLDIIGWLHAILGGIGTAIGAICVAIPALMVAYGVYDFVYGLLYLMVGPQYIGYALESLMNIVALAALFAVPALFVLASFGLELFAGVGLLRRWPRARIAGLVAVVPSLALGLPGLLLGVGTVVVLNDEEVKAALAS